MHKTSKQKVELSPEDLTSILEIVGFTTSYSKKWLEIKVEEVNKSLSFNNSPVETCCEPQTSEISSLTSFLSDDYEVCGVCKGLGKISGSYIEFSGRTLPDEPCFNCGGRTVVNKVKSGV